MLNFDTVIVGAGIAGITCAIQLKRAGKKVIIIEKDVIGGQLNNISLIENYPGLVDISGPDFAYNCYEQIKKLDIEVLHENVKNIQIEDNFKIIKTDTKILKSNAVVIASGRQVKKLGIENEEELIGKGVSYCALCDGFFFKNKDVAVIGGGNSALHEALYLSNLCSKVYLIHYKNEFRADDILVKKVMEKSNIEIKINSKLTQINEENGVLSSIKVNDELINVSGLFIYVGFVPNLDFIDGIETRDGYINVDEKMKTSIEGIYACGDIIKKDIYQMTTAVGEATTAANSILEYLKN